VWICHIPPQLQRETREREREREREEEKEIGKERQKNERTDDREFVEMIRERRKGCRRGSRLSVDELGCVHGVSVIQNAICIGGACLRKSQMRSD